MLQGYMYLFLTAILWSFAGICIRFNSQSALLISVVNAIIGFVFNRVINHQKLILNKTVIFTGFCQFMMGMTFIYANQLTMVGNAIILQYTSMIFVLIYRSIDTRKLPNYQELIVIAVVILGMILFFFDSLSMKGIIGNIMAIVSGAFYGLQFYVNTKPKAHPYTSMMIGFCMSMLFIAFVFQDFKTVLPIEWVAMLTSGIVCAGLGSLCFTKGIQIVSAFTANMICMLEILFSPLWAFLIFQETIGKMSFMGAIVMMGGILFHLYDESKILKINKRKEVLL